MKKLQERAGHYQSEMIVRPITDREFSFFQSLIHREAGIYLSQAKKALLVGRLSRRLREMGLNCFEAYYRIIERNSEERVRMLDCICTNETHFFREPRHFEFLVEKVFPEWLANAASGRRQKRIRIWSAGCSTGEEPYSLAMILLHYFPPHSGWEIDILATDLSTRVLERARAGIWPLEKSKEITSQYLKNFMLKGTRTQEGKMKAGPEIRSIIRFQHLNINDDVYPVVGLFDMIFCRNVLIYFNTESKSRVVNRLLNHLSPNGYFFLGHAESLNGVTDRVCSVIPTVYTPSKDKRQAIKSQYSTKIKKD